MQKIKFFGFLEIITTKLKELIHIIVLLSCFVIVFILYKDKDVSFGLGLIVGFVLMFGIGYFLNHDNYEKLNNLYKEERRKNKDWEEIRNEAFKTTTQTDNWRTIT